MPTRDLSNKRIKVAIGLANSITNLAAPAITELNALLDVTEAIRWDGFDFGAQESDQVDDRSLADDAGAVLRGFAQFGGATPFFFPKRTDLGSILRQAYNILKTDRVELILVERVGFKDFTLPFAAGDDVNTYRVVADGFNPDTEGDGGYAYVVNMLPKGDVYPWTIVPAAAPAALALVGALTQALAVGAVALRGATYQGKNVTSRAQWVSSAPTVCPVDNHGVVGPAKSAGSASITASFPGGTASPPLVVTVT